MKCINCKNKRVIYVSVIKMNRKKTKDEGYYVPCVCQKTLPIEKKYIRRPIGDKIGVAFISKESIIKAINKESIELKVNL